MQPMTRDTLAVRQGTATLPGEFHPVPLLAGPVPGRCCGSARSAGPDPFPPAVLGCQLINRMTGSSRRRSLSSAAEELRHM